LSKEQIDLSDYHSKFVVSNFLEKKKRQTIGGWALGFLASEV
jgi:hypothetical protein